MWIPCGGKKGESGKAINFASRKFSCFCVVGAGCHIGSFEVDWIGSHGWLEEDSRGFITMFILQHVGKGLVAGDQWKKKHCSDENFHLNTNEGKCEKYVILQ